MLLRKILCSSLLCVFISTDSDAQINLLPFPQKSQYPLVVKKNETATPVENGLYEFKVDSDVYEGRSYFYRILVIDQSRFPEFEAYTRVNTIMTPVARSYYDDNLYELSAYTFYLHSIETDFKTELPVFKIIGDFEYVHLEFNDNLSGSELSVNYYDHGHLTKTGSFHLTNFIKLEDIKLDYVHYNARIKKVYKDDFLMGTKCPKKDYEGIVGFIKIPEELSNTSNGWMMGLKATHGKCAVRITNSLAGKFKKGLIIKDSSVSFEGESRTGDISVYGVGHNILTYIDGQPDNNQHAKGKIYMDSIYDKSPKILEFEMQK